MPQDCLLSMSWASEGDGTFLLITCTKHPDFRMYKEYWPNSVEENQILQEHIKQQGD